MDQDQCKQILTGKSPKVNFSQACIFLKGYLKFSLSQQRNNLIKTVINSIKTVINSIKTVINLIKTVINLIKTVINSISLKI